MSVCKLIIALHYLTRVCLYFCGPYPTQIFAEETREPLPPSRFEKLAGLQNKEDALKEQWNQTYNSANYLYGKSPAKFLAENYHYIPANSQILDLGMGEGRNAVFLAQKGYRVTGIDLSSVAAKKAQALAKEFDVKIDSIVASLKNYQFEKEKFDAIICFYYLDRQMINNIKNWLKPGGILIFETYTTRQREFNPKSIKNYSPQELLRPQELLELFSDMRILKFEEPLHQEEFRGSIILQKLEGMNTPHQKKIP